MVFILVWFILKEFYFIYCWIILSLIKKTAFISDEIHFLSLSFSFFVVLVLGKEKKNSKGNGNSCKYKNMNIFSIQACTPQILFHNTNTDLLEVNNHNM